MWQLRNLRPRSYLRNPLPGVLCAILFVTAHAAAQPAAAPAASAAPVGACAGLVDDRGAAIGVPVAWTLRAGAQQRRRLDEQCGTVGPAVLRRAARKAGPSESVAVVGWNVHVGGGDVAGFLRQLTAGAVTGRPVRDYVLLLEEAFRAGPDVPAAIAPGVRVPRRIAPRTPGRSRDDIVSVARQFDLSLYYLPSMRNGARGPAEDRGNAILSTRPLDEIAAIELPFTRQRRVAIAARVDVGGAAGESLRLRVVTTHLDALAGPSRLWIFASGWRGGEARALVDALEDTEPAVIGGDLNTWMWARWERAYRRLASAWPPLPPMRPGGRAHGRLDYLFHTLPPPWRATARELRERFGSDHQPIVAELCARC